MYQITSKFIIQSIYISGTEPIEQSLHKNSKIKKLKTMKREKYTAIQLHTFTQLYNT